MLISPAWLALPGAARDVVFRIAIEHMNHAGTENGELPVTYEDFVNYGIRKSSIALAIRQAEALGLIKVTHRGRGGNSEFRRASRYALGWLPTVDGQLPENKWRWIHSDEEAQAILAGLKASRTPTRLAA